MTLPVIDPVDAVQFAGDSSREFIRKATLLSTVAGKSSFRSNRDWPTGIHPIQMLLTSVEEIDAFWSWYDLVLGACSPFWVPTFRRDLVPIGTIGASDTQFLIQDRGYADLEFGKNRQAIAFVLSNGSHLYRQVEDAFSNLDGTETIVINQSLGVSFTQSHSNGICFLLYGRLAEDKVKMDWQGHDVATVALSLHELEAPPFEESVFDLGVGVWGAYHGPIGGANARFYVRYDFSPFVTPSNNYVVRFLAQSLGGQSVDVIGTRVVPGSSGSKPGSPWVYVDRASTSTAEGSLFADVGHFAMQIGAAAIVECVWIGLYDPDLPAEPEDPAGYDGVGFPTPPTIPGKFIATIPLGSFTLIRDEGMTSLDDSCPPNSPHSMICGLLL